MHPALDAAGVLCVAVFSVLGVCLYCWCRSVCSLNDDGIWEMFFYRRILLDMKQKKKRKIHLPEIFTA